MSPRILCAGEALIDMLPRQTAAGEAAFVPHAGGAVFNTAIALGRLGAEVGLFTGLSTDLFGELLRGQLAASHVDARLAALSDRPTTLAFVTLTNGTASYAFYDENTAGRMLSVADLPSLSDQTEALFLGGISLAVEPCAQAYTALANREAGRRLVMIDPNIRPGFVGDEPAYRARIAARIAQADIVKLSDEDLAWLQGEASDAAAEALRQTGPNAVLITRGADGASLYGAGLTLTQPAHRAQLVDTVGAGDTFNAGVLAALAERDALSRAALETMDAAGWSVALDLGMKAAAVTVSRAGANPPTRQELVEG